MNSKQDSSYMEMAFGLAEKARGKVSPNPHVGAVVVKNGNIIGTGTHEKPGKPHAEIVALDHAGQQADGSTLYLTLEPCVHFGRTPPCIGRIFQSKVGRVVIASFDPNPIVHKKGYEQLKQKKIAVSVGLREEKNLPLNEFYFKYISQKVPFVTAKIAASLDGKTATRSMESKWISSSSTREYMHLLRAEHDAIMVGIETILKDNPKLTVRHPQWKKKRLTRVILDSNLRFPSNSQIVKTTNKGPVLLFCRVEPPENKRGALLRAGVEVLTVAGDESGLDLNEVLSALAEKEITSVLVEGGARLTSSFLAQGRLDKIFISYSPKIIGGEKAPSFVTGDGIDRLKEAWPLKKTHSISIGKDIIVEGYF